MVFTRKSAVTLSFVLLSLALTSCLSRPESRLSKTTTIPVPRNNTGQGTLLENYAAIIGVQKDELHNSDLYAFIDDWMGAPHRLGGQTKRGIDCSAFINQLYSQVYAKDLPRASYEMAKEVKRKYENQLVEGDLVFFSFGKRKVDHVGLYLGNNKFIHVSTSNGVMISDLHESWFYKYFVRAGAVQ